MNIIGRVTKDAEVRTLSNEKQVVNFSVAINDNYRNKQGERVQQTTYFDCAYWISVKVAALLTKGTLVELTGRVSARAWVDGNGNARSGLNFHTSQIKLHAFAGNGAGERSTSSTTQLAAGNDQQQADDLPF